MHSARGSGGSADGRPLAVILAILGVLAIIAGILYLARGELAAFHGGERS
jgi:hypothetical protein